MTAAIVLTLLGAALLVGAALMVSVPAGIGVLGALLLALGLFAEFGDES